MLYENEEIDFSKRVPSENSNELHLYKARIYKHLSYGDDRLQVRILPHMADVSADDADNLPKYPAFFQGTLPNGIAEKDDDKKGEPSIVWVAATPDFTVGYILGLANYFPGCADEIMKDSWNYPEVKQAIQRSGAITENFDYKDIIVQVRNSTSTYLEFYSATEGYKYMMTSFGDLICITDHKITIQAREGVNSGDAQSTITVEPDTVRINSDTFEVNAKNVILGHHNMNVLATLSESGVSCDGVNLTPIGNIFV